MMDEWRDEDEVNPHLRDTIFEVIANQIRDNDPPETRQTMERLISEGISELNAKKYIGQAVCVEIWQVMKHRTAFNLERYVGNLRRLPEEPIA